jgi:type IV pilus assembly protein PilB
MPNLTDILVERGVLMPEQVGAVSGHDDERTARTLLDRGLITESQFASARAEKLGLRFVELTDYPVDPMIVGLVPAGLCERYGVLPVGHENGHLVLAMADPGDVFALDDVSAVTRMELAPVVATRSDLESAISRYFRADGELSDLTMTIEEESTPAPVDIAVADGAADDVPIVRFVNLIVSQAIQDRASDIHIEPMERDLRVRYRIDGVLHEMQKAPKSIQNGIISRLKIMSEIDISERRKPQDGRMSISHSGRTIDLRVATLPTVWGEKIVMRILDNADADLQLSDLGLLPRNAEVYRRSYTKPYGMILVTGPTGSGKSTTLYTTLQAVSTPEINVITVEDPVEYRMPGINQVQVNPKAGLTFASALRSILRSDPDVVLLGEIRDHETAQIAVEAALTGHLVLSTLHTNDAPSAVTRLIEMDIEPFLVGSALDCVVAQRLARRLCARCKEQYTPEIEDLVNLRVGFTGEVAPVLYRPVGCSRCSNTGYRGRIAVHEIMPMSEEIERLAVTRSSSAAIHEIARAQGMVTLREDGWEKAKLGQTSIEEILRVVA